MELNDIKRKLELFLKTKTKTFLQVRSGERLFVHNGFVKFIYEDFIYFEDKINGVIPISLCDIVFVDFSKDGVSNGY